MRDIQADWVDCCGEVSRVVTRGKSVINSQGIHLISLRNPGLGRMYEDFMTALDDSLQSEKSSVWAFSYLGHDTPQPPLLPTAPLHDLETQIEHKCRLLEKLVPSSTKITIIGHSIGCKISMEMFRRNTTHDIQDVYFLFPTIENMERTERGQEVLPLVTTWRRPAVLVLMILGLLPDFLLNFIIGLKYRESSASFRSAVLDFINCNHFNNCLSLARNELETVLDLDCDTIKQMIGKLHILFGADDGWSPLSYRDNLLRTVPDFPVSDAVIDTLEIPHAFVEFHSEATAGVVGEWIKRNSSK